MKALQDILDKVALAIRFMAGFTVVTGILILMATLISGRGERLRQMALLRTLGASNAHVWRILSSEYLALGFLASLVGVVLALAAFWPLAIFVFDSPFSIDVGVLFVAVVLSSLATLALGLALSRGITTAPPLEVVRQQDLA